MNLKKVKIFLIVLIIILTILIVVSVLLLPKDQKNKDKDEITDNSNEWKKINIGECYYETTVIEIDLDGDNIKEKVGINKTGKYISVNDVNYTANKYIVDSDNEKNKFLQSYNTNQYYFVDLNGDGILEIIHRTFSEMISPITSVYTIYNYKNNNLKEIGNISILGNIPSEVYVKENTIKFKYWPYESPDDYTEEVIYELNV